MEILAPAGGPDSVFAAVRAGADAVYLGADHLSARASAKNFDRQELREAVEYCHRRGVKVYLACNTLVRDEELRDAMNLIEYACTIPVDALIVQDLGLIRLIRQAAPEMRLHGSTQMSVHTPMGAKLLYDMGFRRVVLSRELSAEEIREIVQSCPIEAEVFVHGALCMCVSGQCYFSAMLGSRSGNRGACAQPCRLPFSVVGGTGHDLSLKDCSLIGHLREMDAMGITSAKIEGRMKRPEYVAAAVSACRQSLDQGSVDPRLSEQLKAVFSRSGFTDGYWTGKRGVSMFGIRSKEDVTSASNQVCHSLHTLYKDERQSVPVTASLVLQENRPAELTVRDSEGRTVTVQGARPERAVKVALTEEKCRSYLRKTGGTPFALEELSLTLGNGLSYPASEFNALRRQALSELLVQRTARPAVSFGSVSYPAAGTRPQTPPKYCRARFANGEVPDEFLDCELIYVPMDLPDETYLSLMDRGFAVAVEIPRGMFGIEKKTAVRLRQIQALGINEVLASNLGAVELAKSLKLDIHGGFGLNLMNTAAIGWAERMGLMDAEVSFELTLEQIRKLGGRLPIGIVSGGRLPLMLTRNDPSKNSRDPGQCDHILRDRKGMEFPLQTYGTCTEVLNAVPLILSDRKNEMVGIDFEVFRYSVENLVETGENPPSFHRETGRKGAFTRGLYYRGVE